MAARMDNGGGTLEVFILGRAVGLRADFHEGFFKAGVFPFGCRFLLQHNQVAAHLRSGIVGKEVVGQADGGQKPCPLHEVLAHGSAHRGVHHPLRGDESHDAALAHGIQPLDEEIIVQGVHREAPCRAIVHQRVKYADVAEGDVARRHVEPPVVLWGKLLEALHTDIRTGLKLPEDTPGQQVLFIRGGFGHSGGVVEMRLEGRQEIARAR